MKHVCTWPGSPATLCPARSLPAAYTLVAHHRCTGLPCAPGGVRAHGRLDSGHSLNGATSHAELAFHDCLKWRVVPVQCWCGPARGGVCLGCPWSVPKLLAGSESGRTALPVSTGIRSALTEAGEEQAAAAG